MTPRGQRKRTKRLGLISLGCPKNTVDSERLLGELARLGWEVVSNPARADCLVVNTCGFINDAVLESEEAIAEICGEKSRRPGVILAVTGCLPQRMPALLRTKFPEVDLIVGTGSLAELPRLIDCVYTNRQKPDADSDALTAAGRATLSRASDPRLRLSPPWTAYMKIADGCSHECSFCTIPSIKGPHVSRPVDDLVAEAQALAAEGVKELILVSQDTTAYGSDIGTNLRVLLNALDQVDGIRWIRLHYLYPSKVSQSLVETIAKSKRVIPYFDIPLQHVSEKILRNMKRLDPDINVRKLIANIRAPFLGTGTPACVRTTFIVGFPGETEDDFEQIIDFMEDVRLDRVSVFEYSPEEGTAAAQMNCEVQKAERENRMYRLMDAQYDISLSINREWIGKELEVVVESVGRGKAEGRSYRDAPEIDGRVLIRGLSKDMKPGEFVKVKVTEAHPHDLEAEPCSNSET